MTVLTRDAIFAAARNRRPPVAVDIPELGGTVHVRTLNAGERARLDGAIGKVGRERMRPVVAAHCVCDESGDPLFTDADIPALEECPAKALDRIIAVADKLNALTQGEADALGELSAATVVAA